MAALLKELYNTEYIDLLSIQLSLAYPTFKKKSFISEVFSSEWGGLELKQRMRHIVISLHQHLTQEYHQNIEILKKVFSEINYSYGLENMIFQDFVEVYGLNHFKISMNALAHFTINSSSEFAIRRFILKYPDESMAQMREWAYSENEHIRRLASEGSRPRLPWAIALHEFKKEPAKVLVILEILKDDESRYVQKSVANSINDISKDNPDVVKKLVTSWLGESKSRDWICKHGSRTLLKKSDREILNLFGFKNLNHIKLNDFQVSKMVKIGEELEFSFTLDSNESLGKLRLEFAIDFLRQNSKHNKKVFKIAEGVYKESSKKFSKKYSFKTISTRVYYRGVHKLSIIINGEEFIKKEFILS